MQLPQPYLFTSQRTVAIADRQQMVPREGPVADSVYGYHTLWAAEVPFIPAYVGRDDRGLEEDASHHITRVLERQVRFLYDIAQSRDDLATLELRFVCWPQLEGHAHVGIVFFGKTFHVDEQTSRRTALALWDKFSAVFPHEAPLSYPLIPVMDPIRAPYPQSHSFAEWYQPFPFEQLDAPQRIVELRKYEDWPTIRGVGGVLHARDYIPHPFVPALDYTAMARLFETMARQREICIVAITLRPQRLADQEIVILHELASWYQRASRGETVTDNPMAEVLRELKSDIFESYTRSRAELGLRVYENLVREQRSLFLARLQVIGVPVAQDDLIEALGSEVMANAGSAYPSRWSRVEPDPQELRWARFNLQWLEFARWGISPIIRQYPPIVRLRQLATVQEATGAFRLPVAPGGGGLAGLDVRDEPFSIPTTLSIKNGKRLEIGIVLDRGIPTDVSFALSLTMVARLSMLFGEAEVSRAMLLKKVLTAIQAHAVPWILIRGGDALEMNDTSQRAVRHIVVNDPTRADVQLYPFLPPLGVLITTFLDMLQSVFVAAYGLNAAAGMVLRRALIEVYRAAGWIGTARGQMLDLTQIATHIDTVAQQAEIPAQTGALLRTRCVLALQDLAITMPLPPIMDASDLWSEPTLIDVNWPGSYVNDAVIRGSLWGWLALALPANRVSSDGPRGILGLENVHSLFGSIGDRKESATETPSPLIPLAQALARSGVGTFLIDNRPDLFHAEMIENAGVTFITRNVNTEAQKSVTSVIGASARQQARIRQLREREVVISVRGSEPVLVMLDE